MKKPVNVCDLPHDAVTLATDKYDIQLDGSRQKGDICEDHKVELKSLLGTLVPMRAAARARRATTTKRTTRKRVTRKTTAKRAPARRRKASDSEVRAWAVSNGVDVNQKGRIPAAIRDQYLASK